MNVKTVQLLPVAIFFLAFLIGAQVPQGPPETPAVPRPSPATVQTLQREVDDLRQKVMELQRDVIELRNNQQLRLQPLRVNPNRAPVPSEHKK